MPSIIINNQSGGQPIVSGNPWSGKPPVPVGTFQLVASIYNSGCLYVALSGSMTVNSGSLSASGFAQGGLLDGVEIAPGGSYSIPKLGFANSGTFNPRVIGQPACSGQSRLYFEPF